MIGLLGWRPILGAALLAATLAGGLWVRGQIRAAEEMRVEIALVRADRDAAVQAAADSARRAREAAESERRVAAELTGRIDAIDDAAGACLDDALPSSLWEGGK